MFGRDRKERIQTLAQKAEQVELETAAIEAQEPMVSRMTQELKRMREENHFTQLFVSVVGGKR